MGHPRGKIGRLAHDEEAVRGDVTLYLLPYAFRRLVRHEAEVDRGACLGVDGVRRRRPYPAPRDPAQIQSRREDLFVERTPLSFGATDAELLLESAVDVGDLGHGLSLALAARRHVRVEVLDEDLRLSIPHGVAQGREVDDR